MYLLSSFWLTSVSTLNSKLSEGSYLPSWLALFTTKIAPLVPNVIKNLLVIMARPSGPQYVDQNPQKAQVSDSVSSHAS